MDSYAYGLWPLVVVNSVLFIVFAFSFSHPVTGRDWRQFGAFSAFIVALFAEMFGFPLTIYILSGWLVHRFPGINIYSHDAGHFWYLLFGGIGDPHASAIHVASNLIIFSGFILLAASWRVLYRAQISRGFATTGPYAHIRHPQYLAFIFISLGLFLQWPTLLTLVMFPILSAMYVRLARREDDAMFGEEYETWARKTPAFIPVIGGRLKRPRKDEHPQTAVNPEGGNLEWTSF